MYKKAHERLPNTGHKTTNAMLANQGMNNVGGKIVILAISWGMNISFLLNYSLTIFYTLKISNKFYFI